VEWFKCKSAHLVNYMALSSNLSAAKKMISFPAGSKLLVNSSYNTRVVFLKYSVFWLSSVKKSYVLFLVINFIKLYFHLKNYINKSITKCSLQAANFIYMDYGSISWLWSRTMTVFFKWNYETCHSYVVNTECSLSTKIYSLNMLFPHHSPDTVKLLSTDKRMIDCHSQH
jgi:hypothetical protein